MNLNEDFDPAENISITEDYSNNPGDYNVTYVAYNPVQDSLFNVLVFPSALVVNFTSIPNQYTQEAVLVTIIATNLVDNSTYEQIINVNINSVNDAPEATIGLSGATDEDQPTDIVLSGSDVDNNNLIFSLDTNGVNGSVVIDGNIATYAPNQDFNGYDCFEYKENE